MVVHFVDIGGIVDHHCLNILFIKSCYLKLGVSIRSSYCNCWQRLPW